MLRTAGLLLLLAWGWSQAQDDTFLSPAISPAELAQRQETDAPLLVIDVRGKPEYRGGHVPGALNIPPGELPRHLDELREANGVVLYCSNGSRTRIAEATLAEYDIPDLFHLEGGVFGWRNSGHKLLTGWGPP